MMSFQDVIKQPWLRWAVGILMIVLAIGILLASYFYFAPYNFPISKMTPQAGQTLIYGGLAMAVAVFTLLWPGAGGLITILYGILKLTEFWGMHPPHLTLMPDALYYVLYGLFFICGIMSLIIGINRRKISERQDDFYQDFRMIARLTALVPIIIVIIAYFFIYPPVIFFTIPAIAIVIIAWVWPLPGAVLMLMICLTGFYELYQVNWEISWKWPLFLFLGVFFISSIMHFVLAWLQRK
jgi:hypothetical protein